MAKKTLLELTQDILSNMDSDEVNSISDTIESLQVASVIRQTYYDIVDEQGLPSTGSVVNLTGLGDTDTPTHMMLPESVSDIEWIKYDNRLESSDPYSYATIIFKCPEEFLNICNSRDRTDTDNYQTVMYNANTPIVVAKNSGPSFWTSFDDEYIVFDAYNSDIDATLQTSKCVCFGHIRPELDLDDDAIPDLPENLFSYLQAKAESTCKANNQKLDQKAEQRENRLRIRSMRNQWRSNNPQIKTDNYGRK